MVAQLHHLLLQLIPGGAKKDLSAAQAKVLLASVRPFQLMAGKLLGMVAVSMTMVLVYLTGAYFTANQMGFAQYVSIPTLIWFGGLAVLSPTLTGTVRSVSSPKKLRRLNLTL